jgi:hypothetical protein
MMVLLPKWLAGFSGRFVEATSYPQFFTMTAFLGLPVLLLLSTRHAKVFAPALWLNVLADRSWTLWVLKTSFL